MKQPRYPVLYLTCGKSDLYEDYKDYRCEKVETAAYFAVSEGLRVSQFNAKAAHYSIDYLPRTFMTN